jgi:hypothetical protein
MPSTKPCVRSRLFSGAANELSVCGEAPNKRLKLAARAHPLGCERSRRRSLSAFR